MNSDPRIFLIEFAKVIISSPRQGLEKDEPEGVRIVTLQMTDTLANEITKKLIEIADLLT